MSWVRLDDGYPEHSKVADLTDAAFRADVEGTCFSSRSKRDGHIPSGVALRLWGRGAITELVAAGRWHEGHGCGSEDCIHGPGDGYIVHDFLEYNDPNHVRDARSNAARNAARSRWGNAENEDSAMRTYIGVGGLRSSKDKESDEFIEFYEQAYPRRSGRGAARKAWEKATRKALPSDIVAAAYRYAADPNREPAFTKHPSTWLNQECWTDDPLPPRGSGNGRVIDRSALALRRIADRRAK